MNKTKPPVYVETITGKIIDLNADKYLLDVEDVALGLARIRRFNGRTLTDWSVAQHSLSMFYYAKEVRDSLTHEELVAILLHDASEVLTGDIITPVKNLVPEFKMVEAEIQAKVYNRFKVHNIPRAVLDRADKLACHTEWNYLIASILRGTFFVSDGDLSNNTKAYGFYPETYSKADHRVYYNKMQEIAGWNEQRVVQDFSKHIYQHLATYGE